MPLIGDDLGTALNNARNAFNGLTPDQVTDQYGSLANMRLAMAKAEGNVIVNYFTANAGILPGTFTTSEGPVEGLGEME